MVTITGTGKGKNYATNTQLGNKNISRNSYGGLNVGSTVRGTKVITTTGNTTPINGRGGKSGGVRKYSQDILNKAAIGKPGSIIPEAYIKQGQFVGGRNNNFRPKQQQEQIIMTPAGATFIEGKQTSSGAVIPFNERTSGVYVDGKRVGETLKRPEVLYGYTEQEMKKEDDWNSWYRANRELYKKQVREEVKANIEKSLRDSKYKTYLKNASSYSATYQPKKILEEGKERLSKLQYDYEYPRYLKQRGIQLSQEEQQKVNLDAAKAEIELKKIAERKEIKPLKGDLSIKQIKSDFDSAIIKGKELREKGFKKGGSEAYGYIKETGYEVLNLLSLGGLKLGEKQTKEFNDYVSLKFNRTNLSDEEKTRLKEYEKQSERVGQRLTQLQTGKEPTTYKNVINGKNFIETIDRTLSDRQKENLEFVASNMVVSALPLGFKAVEGSVYNVARLTTIPSKTMAKAFAQKVTSGALDAKMINDAASSIRKAKNDPSPKNVATALVDGMFSSSSVSRVSKGLYKRVSLNTRPSITGHLAEITRLAKYNKQAEIKVIKKIQADKNLMILNTDNRRTIIYKNEVRKATIKKVRGIFSYFRSNLKDLKKKYGVMQKYPSFVRKEIYSEHLNLKQIQDKYGKEKFNYHVAPYSEMKSLFGQKITEKNKEEFIRMVLDKAFIVDKGGNLVKKGVFTEKAKEPVLLKFRNATKVILAQAKKNGGIIYGGKATDFRSKPLARKYYGLKFFSSDYDIMVKDAKKVAEATVKRLKKLDKANYTIKPVKRNPGTYSIFRDKEKLADFTDIKTVRKQDLDMYLKANSKEMFGYTKTKKYNLNIQNRKGIVIQNINAYFNKINLGDTKGALKHLNKVKLLTNGKLGKKQLETIRKNPKDILEVYLSPQKAAAEAGAQRKATGAGGSLYVSVGEALKGYAKGEERYVILRFDKKLSFKFKKLTKQGVYKEFPTELKKRILKARSGKLTKTKETQLERDINKFYTNNPKIFKNKWVVASINLVRPKQEQQVMLIKGSRARVNFKKKQVYDAETQTFSTMYDLSREKVKFDSIIAKLLKNKRTQPVGHLLKRFQDAYGSSAKEVLKNIVGRVHLDYNFSTRSKVEKHIERLKLIEDGYYNLGFTVNKVTQKVNKAIIAKIKQLIPSKMLKSKSTGITFYTGDFIKQDKAFYLKYRRSIKSAMEVFDRFIKSTGTRRIEAIMPKNKYKYKPNLTKQKVLAEANRILGITFRKGKLGQVERVIQNNFSIPFNLKKGKTIKQSFREQYKKVVTAIVKKAESMKKVIKKVEYTEKELKRLEEEKIKLRKYYNSLPDYRKKRYIIKVTNFDKRLQQLRKTTELRDSRRITDIIRRFRARFRPELRQRITLRVRKEVRIRERLPIRKRGEIIPRSEEPRPRPEPPRPRPRIRIPERPRTRIPARNRERIPERPRDRVPTRPRIRIPNRPRERIPVPPPTTRIPPRLSDWGERFRDDRSFNVYAKTGGMKTKYIRINAGGLRLIDAFNYGKYVIDKSKLASFKILPSSARPTMKFGLQIPNHKFTFSRRNPNIIIEKRRYRMDIRTEHREIAIRRLRRLKNQRSVVGFFRKLFK